MPKRLRLPFFIAAIALAFSAHLAVASTAMAKMKRVFIVASYASDDICGEPQEMGVLEGLKHKGFTEGVNLKVARFHMDTKGKNITPQLIRKQARLVNAKIRQFKPDVVVTIDDNAFREAGLPLAGRTDVSVVFTGMNGQPEDYHKMKSFMTSRKRPGSNITGVYEKLYVEQSIRVMGAIPGLTGDTIVFISTNNPTGKAISKQFALELKSPIPGLKYRFEKVNNWAEYTKLIHAINEDDSVMAILPVAVSLRVDKNTIYTAKDIFPWTVANSKKPEMALNYFFSKVGFFGGAAVDFKAMGELAGLKAGEILIGTPTGSLPIEDARDYAIVFNIKRARALNITIPMPLLTAADYVYKQ